MQYYLMHYEIVNCRSIWYEHIQLKKVLHHAKADIKEPVALLIHSNKGRQMIGLTEKFKLAIMDR